MAYLKEGVSVDVNLFELKKIFESGEISSYIVECSYLRDEYTEAYVYFKPDNIFFKDGLHYFCIRNINKVTKNGNMLVIYDRFYEYVVICN